jgi:hypothetical protein
VSDALDAVPLILGTSIWTTVAVALIAGFSGVFAGAAAAAVVTTRHERLERFRARMIDAGDDFVGKLMHGLELVDDSDKQVRELFTESQSHTRDDQKVHAMLRALDKTLVSADQALDEVSRLIPRLYVVFRGRSVGDGAAAAEAYLRQMKRHIDEGLAEIRGGERLLRGDLETGEWREVSPWEELKKDRESFDRVWGDLLKRLNAAIRRTWRL